jgi:hypothetical protein
VIREYLNRIMQYLDNKIKTDSDLSLVYLDDRLQRLDNQSERPKLSNILFFAETAGLGLVIAGNLYDKPLITATGITLTTSAAIPHFFFRR